jgi:hypothetical protein
MMFQAHIIRPMDVIKIQTVSLVIVGSSNFVTPKVFSNGCRQSKLIIDNRQLTIFKIVLNSVTEFTLVNPNC